MKRLLASIIIRNFLRLSHYALCKLKSYYRFRGIELLIPCGAFNPTFTLSTSLVAELMDIVKPKGVVVDFGCGSGVLAIYLSKYFNVKEVICYDVDEYSLAVAKVNARINKVERKIRLSRNLKNIKADMVIAKPTISSSRS